jgi:hypothetical protein
MRRNLAFAGFVLTEEEWDGLDELARAQLIAAVTRRDGWIAAPPVARAVEARVGEGVPEPIEGPEPYAHYELVVHVA